MPNFSNTDTSVNNAESGSSPSTALDQNVSKTINVRNPRTGQYDYTFKASSAADVARSANLRRTHQVSWEQSGVENRIAVLRQWQAALMKHKDAITTAVAADTGRISLATAEFFALLGSIDRWCDAAPELLIQSRVQSKGMPDVEIFSDVSPYPLLGAISPWNFPLLLSFIDVMPALLAGSAAIIKPSEVTSRFIEPLKASINEIDELSGVLDIVAGDGEVGQALIHAADVIAFTGSVATGRKVAVAAAENFIPAFLELGGKDPAVILPNSDLERAATSILRGSVSATGQACQSIERVYVHQSQHDEFVTLLQQKAEQVELSREDPNKGSIGPLIFDRQAAIIDSQLDDALAKGAKIVCGGKSIDDAGARWVEPTILTDVDHTMDVMCDETFGPVMPVMAYDDIEQAVELANHTRYGLSAAVFGPDEDQALNVARQIKAGGVSVNDSGMTSMVFETEKNAFAYSGMGPSRVGPEGLTRFLRKKSLYVNRGAVTPQSVFNEGG